jgi:hypothetical protein
MSDLLQASVQDLQVAFPTLPRCLLSQNGIRRSDASVRFHPTATTQEDRDIFCL